MYVDESKLLAAPKCGACDRCRRSTLTAKCDIKIDLVGESDESANAKAEQQIDIYIIFGMRTLWLN